MDRKVAFLTVILFCCEITIMRGKCDIARNNEIFWLSENDIAMILNYSFPQSRCCNVCVNSNMTDGEYTLFKLFVSTYKNEYCLGKVVNQCIDYLLIASMDQEFLQFLERIPSVVSMARILILVDSKSKEDSPLFKVSIYEHWNVNIIFQNVSYILSGNHMDPRVFKKITRYKELEKRSGLVNFQGRRIHASTFYNPPLCFLKSSINRTINGMPAIVFLAKDPREMDGIELHLFLIIAKVLNFTYTLRQPTGRYKHGRKYNDSTFEGGMIGQIVQKEVDIAFGSIWINLDNYQFANLTQPWTQIFLRFLVPRPRPYTSFWALTRPLSPTIWCLLIMIISFESAYVCAKARLDPLIPERYRNVIVTTTELLGRMLGTWLPTVPSPLRLQTLLWDMIGFIIVTVYCSSLAAKLTNLEFEDRIDTLQHFVERNLTWGREGTEPPFKEYFDMEDKYAKQMSSRFILEQSKEDRINRVFQGNYALIGRIVGRVYYPEGAVTDEALQTLRVMKQTTAQFYTSFAVQPWLLDPINTVTIRLRESGIVLYNMQDVIHRRTGTHLREVFIERDRVDYDRAIVLTVYPLGVGFAALIFGFVLSGAVFYTEFRYVTKKFGVLRIFHSAYKKERN